jgi:hypothetical protein
MAPIIVGCSQPPATMRERRASGGTADAQDSGSCEGNLMGVQIPPRPLSLDWSLCHCHELHWVGMRHAAEQIQRALTLRARGLSIRTISDRLGIPSGTVDEWIYRRLPDGWSSREPRCKACGGSCHRFEELPPSYSYLLGLYLGDGSIASHARDVYKLRLSLDPAYPRIVEEAELAMRQVLPANKVNTYARLSGEVEVYSYSKAWPCLLPQHGPGKKHLRRIELSEWQEKLVHAVPHLLLRGLIHSDGCRFMNTGRNWRCPRYSFSNLSADIRLIFTKACDELGLRWTTSGRTVYVSRKADVEKMDRFIGPKA